MIELKNGYVTHAAINAGMSREVFIDQDPDTHAIRPPACVRLRLVLVDVAQIVLMGVGMSA